MNFQMDGLDIFCPSEPQMNLVALITTGLLDRYPGLKIIHAEQGARYIRPLAEWLDELHGPHVAAYEQGESVSSGWRRKLAARAPQLLSYDEGSEKNHLLPSYYFRRNFYWTIETEEPELVDGIRFAGADRFLFATDYPHDDPGGQNKFADVAMLAANDLLSERTKEHIRWKNAKEIFRLDAFQGSA
jgi:predicted TIM-barrel fold metal-dependent hydrolase